MSGVPSNEIYSRHSELINHLNAKTEELKLAFVDVSKSNSAAMADMKSNIQKLQAEVKYSVGVTNALALSLAPASFKKRKQSALIMAQARSVDYFLTPEFLARVSGATAAKFFERLYVSQVITTPMQCLQVMMFAKPPGARVAARRSPEGKLFHEMRVKVLKNVIYNCECAAAKDFETEDVDNIDRQDGEPGGSVIPINNLAGTGGDFTSEATPLRRPMWAEKNFIKANYIASFVQTEATNGGSSTGERSSQGLSNGEVSDEEPRTPQRKKRKVVSVPLISVEEAVSNEVLREMWIRGTKWLNAARGECRKTFTKMLGFVFYSSCDPAWSHNFHEEYAAAAHNLPDASTSSDTVHISDVNRTNRERLQAIADGHPGLSMQCEYTVQVFSNESDCGQMEVYGEQRKLSRTIGLLEVALHMSAAYFQFTTSEGFLRSTRYSIRFVFRLACALSYALAEAHRRRSLGTSLEHCCEELKEVGLVILSDSARVSIIKESSLRMTVRPYNEFVGRSERGGTADVASETVCEVLSDDEDVENVF